MSPRLISALWNITALIALLLLFATAALAIKASANEDGTLTGYVNGPGASIYLRVRPSDESRIVSILEPDTMLWIQNSIIQDGQIWYHIETDAYSGWLPSGNVSLEHP